MPRGAKSFELRRALERIRIVRHQVVDRLLAFLHPRHVISERGQPVDAGRAEAQQRRDLAAAVVVLVDALLEDGAEILPEGRVILVVLGAGREFGQHLAGHGPPDAAEDGRRLQHLARHVERQVLRVDDTLDEAQPGRQQVGVVGDEHAPHVQPHLAVALALDRVERLRTRDEEQRRELACALRAPVQRRPRLVEEEAELAVEGRVGLLVDLGLRLAPQRGALVAGDVLAVPLDGDRHRDVVGPLLHDVLEPDRLQEFVRVGAHVHDDVRASLGALGRGERVAALSVRRPGPGLALAGRARGDLDALRHHERGVEADAELPDEVRLVAPPACRRATG